jgi:hypothetical protein
MKLLVILCSHLFDSAWCSNVKILNDYIKSSEIEVEYCGISNQNDFYNYESVIQFKYKIINTENQIIKLCDFITDYKAELNYDWYMKFRPDTILLENINFNILSENAINARARVYNGPSKIKYGMSVNGEGVWKNTGDCHYSDEERDIILDDMVFIFHKNIVQSNAFNKIDSPMEHRANEWTQTAIFNSREIPLNVVGIYLCFSKYNTFSGNINM